MNIRRIAHQLAALFRARRLDRELEGEIAAHLEMAEADGVAAGLSRSEARRRARLQFGGVEGVTEAHRDRRSVRWLEILLKDATYGIKLLGRDAGFTAVVVGGAGPRYRHDGRDVQPGRCRAGQVAAVPGRCPDRARLGSAAPGRDECHERAGFSRLAASGQRVRRRFRRARHLGGDAEPWRSGASIRQGGHRRLLPCLCRSRRARTHVSDRRRSARRRAGRRAQPRGVANHLRSRPRHSCPQRGDRRRGVSRHWRAAARRIRPRSGAVLEAPRLQRGRSGSAQPLADRLRPARARPHARPGPGADARDPCIACRCHAALQT